MKDSTTLFQSIDEGARRRFEVARRNNSNQPIEDYLPASDHAHYLATLEEIILIDMEFAWKGWKQTSGDPESPTGIRPPGVESYLQRFPVLHASDVLGRLLRHEYLVRHRYGDRPDAEEFCSRFPAMAERENLVQDLRQIARVIAQETGPSAALGARMGRYLLCGEHARGGFGLVWRAEDEALGREVALKQLNAQLLEHAGYRQRFLAEARIAAQLQHPGIVPVYDIGDPPNGEPYYTMKLVRGETLSAAISRFHDQPRPAGEQAVEQLRLLNAFLSVTRALAYAHSRQVIHRDLKPDNILLGAFGETVLLDWGLAKVLGGTQPAVGPVPAAGGKLPAEATQVGTIMGTPAYMPPEQASGRVDEVDMRSDVYALGAILYQLLTGRPPFLGNNTAEVLRQVLHDTPPRPRSLGPEIPRSLEAICLRALAKVPDQRYAEVGLLARDLEGYLADEPVTAYREHWRDRLPRWARRHRTIVATVGVALLLLAAGAVTGLFVWQEGKHDRENRERIAELKRQEDLQQLRLGVETDEKIALEELRASHFEQAERLLARVASRARNEPELASNLARLDVRHAEAVRLKEFYRLANEAEKLAFLEYDEEADAACLRGLRILISDFSSHLLDWSERDHLPAAGLTNHQLEQLREDAFRVSLLAGTINLNRGLMRPADSRNGLNYFGNVVLRLAIGRGYRDDSPAIQLMHVICREGRPSNFPPEPPATRFEKAADFYYMGKVLYVLQSTHRDDMVRLVGGQLAQQLGFGVRRIGVTTEWMFRSAAALEPQHFWPHFWLGRNLFDSGDYEGAELAFNTCIVLRPENALGYAERARMFESQWARQRQRYLGHFAQLFGAVSRGPLASLPMFQHCWREFEPHSAGILQELPRRILLDLDAAVLREPREPWIQFLVGESQWRLGRETQALAAWNTALLFERPLQSWVGQLRFRDIRNRLDLAAHCAYECALRDPNRSDAWAILATALFRLEQGKAASRWAQDFRMPGRYEPALWAADNALRANPALAQAMAVHGAVAMELGEYEKANRQLTATLELDSANHFAAASLARVLVQMGKRDRALAQFDRMHRDNLAPTAWHQQDDKVARANLLLAMGRPNDALAEYDAIVDAVSAPRHFADAQLGRARIFAARGDREQAEYALDDAEMYDFEAADRLRTQLFPDGGRQ